MFCYVYLSNISLSEVLFESAPKHLQVRMTLDGEFSSTCAEAHGWANLSIFTFGKFVSQMTILLQQLLRRVFAFHQCPFHTRAHHWGFALFAFTTFTERDPKNVGVFLENLQRFSFFLRRFLKSVGRFMSFFPRFWKLAAVCRQPGCPECHFFLFFCRKNASFQHSCVKVVKAKKCKPLEMRPRVTCAREKVIFLKVKSYTLQICLTEGKGLQISLSSLEYFKPQNHDSCFFVKQYDQV